jgi:D-glycero-D-manno-heptose 1,7-bisphosphate phosphatase
MVRQAERDLNLDLSRSFIVGDRWRDIEVGRAVGVRTVLVRTGYGRTEELHPQNGLTPDTVTDNIVTAVVWILQQDKRGAGR